MSDTAVVSVGPKGRVVIPAGIRRELGIEEGSELRRASSRGRRWCSSRDRRSGPACVPSLPRPPTVCATSCSRSDGPRRRATRAPGGDRRRRRLGGAGLAPGRAGRGRGGAAAHGGRDRGGELVRGAAEGSTARRPAGVVAGLLASFGLTVVDVTPADAEIAADLWHRGTELSLADRLCIALGVRVGLPVATADAAWSAMEGSPAVILVR